MRNLIKGKFRSYTSDEDDLLNRWAYSRQQNYARASEATYRGFLTQYKQASTEELSQLIHSSDNEVIVIYARRRFQELTFGKPITDFTLPISKDHEYNYILTRKLPEGYKPEPLI